MKLKTSTIAFAAMILLFPTFGMTAFAGHTTSSPDAVAVDGPKDIGSNRVLYTTVDVNSDPVRYRIVPNGDCDVADKEAMVRINPGPSDVFVLPRTLMFFQCDLPQEVRFTAASGSAQDRIVSVIVTDRQGGPYPLSISDAQFQLRIAPKVISTEPARDATGVQISSPITATFSEQIKEEFLSNPGSFIVEDENGNNIAGTISYSGVTARFTPSSNLQYSTKYIATIASTIEDLSGNPLYGGDYSWSFTTEAAPDATAPKVTETAPKDGEIDVQIDIAAITATFSEKIKASTVNENSFTVEEGEDNIAGSVSVGSIIGEDGIERSIATFRPSSSLQHSTRYIVTLDSTITDEAGNQLVGSPYSWSFTTIAAPNQPPAANDDEYSMKEDEGLRVPAPGVLRNDIDRDGDPLTAILVSDDTANGDLSLRADGSFEYIPHSNFHGTEGFTYKANDGKADSNMGIVTITIEPVADIPNAPTITRPQDGTITNDNTPAIEGTADGAAATTTIRIEVFADGDSLGTTSVDSGSGSWSFTPSSALSDGSHEITATATSDEEEEGGTSQPSDAVTITIDTKAPTVTGTPDREPDSDNGYYSEPVIITWEGDDGGSDGSGIESCDDSTTYSGPDGTSIELTGECIDNAGNTGEYTFTLNYDETGPDVRITKAEDQNDDVANGGTTKSNQIEFRFTASDSASGLQSVECRLDGGSFSDCTSPVEYTKLKKGTHTFEVRAIDQVGNEATDDFSWKNN
jgi:hypothetical protein